MLIDAHAHLDKYPEHVLAEVLEEIEAQRILTVSVSVDPESFSRVEAIAARSRLVVPSFGIHPEQAPRFFDVLESVKDLVSLSPMVGEVGLDHRFVTEEALYGPQQAVFDSLLELAAAQEKLVNLHCAGAEEETLGMLREYRIRRAIIHWYSGPLDVLDRMIDAGYHFTVGVELMYSDHVRRVAELIPVDRLLTETDNPGGLEWLGRGVGRPHHLGQVVEELAHVKGISVDDLVAAINDNVTVLFDGDPHLDRWRTLLD